MISSAFDLGEELHLRQIPYYIYKGLWDKFDITGIDLSFSNWTTIKYLNKENNSLNPFLKQVPNDKGGLYLFHVKCTIISGLTEFPLYIGRAQLTKGQNLRKRTKEYFQNYSRGDERPKITKMFKYWAHDLYLSFIALDENSRVIDLERKIINSLLLPLNDEIPDQEIKQGVKAFQ